MHITPTVFVRIVLNFQGWCT